ncbi:MAG: flagellar biosynthetic protein FliO [Armatimonadota bacterium]
MSDVKRATLVMAIALATTAALAPAWAQDAPVDVGDAPVDDAGYLPEDTVEPVSMSVVDIVGKLIVVLAVAWGVVRAVRWWHDRRLSCPGDGGRGGRRMWLEETLSLGADGRLYLVEVEGRRMLLSARDGNVVEVANVTEQPAEPATYRSVRKRADGSTDELNVARAGLSTRAVRPDVVESDESWEERRGRLLRELQEQG